MQDEDLQQLRELIQRELDSQAPSHVHVNEVVRTAVHETLVTLGLDVSDPIELQKDMAFVRDLRRGSDAVKTKGILVVVGLFVTGIVGAIWLGLKAALES